MGLLISKLRLIIIVDTKSCIANRQIGVQICIVYRRSVRQRMRNGHFGLENGLNNIKTI